MNFYNKIKQTVKKIFLILSPSYRKLEFIGNNLEEKLLKIEKSFNSKYDDINTKINSLNSIVYSFDPRIANINKGLTKLASQLDNVSHKVKGITDNGKDVGLQIDDLNSQVKSIHLQLKDLLAGLGKLEAQGSSLNTGVKSIQSQFSEVGSGVKSINNSTREMDRFRLNVAERIKRIDHNEKSISFTLSQHPDAINEINSDSICIDCGGHIGLISEIFLKLGATVHTFEPNIYLINYMKYRLSEYVNSKKLILENKAVWDRKDSIKLYLRESFSLEDITHIDSESSSILVEKTDENLMFNTSINNFLEVDSIDLTDYLKKIDKQIHILKIDIEGVEFDVLKKMITTEMYKKIKYIFVETHDYKLPAIKSKADAVKKKIKQLDINNIFLDWH